MKLLLTCSKITWRWPLFHCFATRHLKRFQYLSYVYKCVTVSAATKSLKKQFIWPVLLERVLAFSRGYLAMLGLRYTGVLKTGLLPLKRLANAHASSLFVSLLEMQLNQDIFKGIVFRSTVM